MATLPLGSNPATPITSEGDVIVGALDGSPERLPIGTSGQVLTAQPATHLLGDDCILCLPLRANATDVGPNAFAVTNHGTVTFDATDGASFNGTTQYLSLAENALLDLVSGPFSIFITYQWSGDLSGAGFYPLIEKTNDASYNVPANGYELGIYDDSGAIAYFKTLNDTSNNQQLTATPKATGAPSMSVMLSFDPAVGLNIYENGVLDNDASVTVPQPVVANTAMGLLIGAYLGTPNAFFNGTIRDILIVGRVAGANDAIAHYNSGAGQSGGGLTVVVEDDSGLIPAWVTPQGGGGGGGGGGDTPPGYGFVSGGGIAYVAGGLSFIVAAASYYIGGTLYSSPQTTVTLEAADGTHPRIDAIVFDNTGAVVVLKGTAAAAPAVPSYDPGTQISKGDFITVPANATTITAATNSLVYDEDTGPAAEWTATSSGSGWTLDSTVNPLTGTKDILGSAVAAGAYVKFAPAAPVNLADYSNGILSLPIRVVTAWANKRGVQIQWFSGTASKGIAVNVLNGSFAFDASVTSAYQYVIVPLSAFQIPAGTTVDSFRVTVSGGAISLRMDNIRVQGGALQGNGGGLTQAQADARYLQLSTYRETHGDSFDGAGAALAATVGKPFTFPRAGTILGVTLAATDANGAAINSTISVDLWVRSAAIPTVANTVTASSKPVLSGASYVNWTTLTGWTTAVVAGSVGIFKLESNDNAVNLVATVIIGS